MPMGLPGCPRNRSACFRSEIPDGGRSESRSCPDNRAENPRRSSETACSWQCRWDCRAARETGPPVSDLKFRTEVDRNPGHAQIIVQKILAGRVKRLVAGNADGIAELPEKPVRLFPI